MTPADPDRPLPENIWLHGLVMLVLLILVNFTQAVLTILALLQFGWMLFAKERNRAIADFGVLLGDWLTTTARFVSGSGDRRPFPWPDAAKDDARDR